MIKVSMLEPDLKIHTKYLVPQSIKLIDILQMVGHRTIIKGYGELRRDVEENGFKNPIILIPNNQQNYDLAKRRVLEQYVMPWSGNRRYLCMYGNQRMNIALQLGIYNMEAIITPNVEWSHATQLKIDAKSQIPHYVNTLSKTDYTKDNL